MIRPLALYIGLRYTRAKRRNHFISFISLASMLGIGLGVMVLITVLSVLNGFDQQIHKHFFALAPQMTVMTREDIAHTWSSLMHRVNATDGVVASAPYLSGMGMLTHDDAVSGVDVMGIEPGLESQLSQLSDKMVAGRLSSLKAQAYHIILGIKLANQLGLLVGDTVNVFVPQANTTPLGVFPQFRRFTVTGIFRSNSGFGFDSSFAYIHLADAQKLFVHQGVGGLHIKIQNIYEAPTLSQKIQELLPEGFIVTNWTEQYGAFFNAIAMEKTIMFVILLLIIAVAVFNLVATLVMAVNEKRADIAILRTLGARPRTVMSIFIVQGAVIGLLGTLLGVVAGILLSLNITALTDWIQHIFHVQLLQSSVFFVDFLPSQLHYADVIHVALVAFLLSLLATIYPASIAYRTQPAEALRYE